MDIALNAKVNCTDGPVGQTSAIVINPATSQITHVVVKGKGDLIGEYLAPIGVISKGEGDELTLSWTRAELAAAPRFDKAIFLGDTEAGPDSAMVWPYAMADQVNFSSVPTAAFVQVEQVPEAGLAVHVGAHVDATDGRVGKIDEFVIDQATGSITHILLRHGHLWGKHELNVPVTAIDHVENDVVHLNLDKAAIEKLPRADK